MNLKQTIAILVMGIIMFLISFASCDGSENGESKLIANKYGFTREYVLPDRTRVDLLGKRGKIRLAFEVDWAKKWAEGIGQALYYGIMTKRQPAVILLIKDPARDVRYIRRCKTVCDKYGIELYTSQQGSGTLTLIRNERND